MAEGLSVPHYCPRGRTDCSALAQIIAAEHKSFICCGENAKPPMPQDKYVVCFKNDLIDDRQCHDKRDLMQTVGVMAGALSVIEERDSAAYDLRGGKDGDRPVNADAWAIGADTPRGFKVRRIVWGRALARAERRKGEKIRRASLAVMAS